MSGILASITSTITNTFITTGENVGRILRQAWASVVEATSILLFNDKDQYLCDRMTSAAKVLATGASVIVGTVVQEKVMLRLNEIKLAEELKSAIAIFAGSLCTGLMSVSLMFYIDNGPFTKYLERLYGETTRRLKEQGQLFRQYCAELKKIDINELNAKTAYVYRLSLRIDEVSDVYELNALLRAAVGDLGLSSVFGDRTADERLKDKDWVLKFEIGG